MDRLRNMPTIELIRDKAICLPKSLMVLLQAIPGAEEVAEAAGQHAAHVVDGDHLGRQVAAPFFA